MTLLEHWALKWVVLEVLHVLLPCSPCLVFSQPVSRISLCVSWCVPDLPEPECAGASGERNPAVPDNADVSPPSSQNVSVPPNKQTNKQKQTKTNQHQTKWVKSTSKMLETTK